MHARVRHNQARLAESHIAVQDEIKVERSRPPALLSAAISAVLSLDLEECIEKASRRQSSIDEDRAVEVRTLRTFPLRLSFPDGRNRDQGGAWQIGEAYNRGTHVPLAVAEVAAQCDDGMNRIVRHIE